MQGLPGIRAVLVPCEIDGNSSNGCASLMMRRSRGESYRTERDRMTRLVLPLVMLWAVISTAVPAVAQHFEAGAFVGYAHLDVPNLPQNTVALGGRVDLPFYRFIKFEVEGGYDFPIPDIAISSAGNVAITTTKEISGWRMNGGLKFQSHGGSYFFFLKGGGYLLQPSVSVRVIGGVPIVVSPPATTTNSVWKGTFYPGAGISFFAGPIGMRLDVGDEILWLDGNARNNLRINFGPSFRF